MPPYYLLFIILRNPRKQILYIRSSLILPSGASCVLLPGQQYQPMNLKKKQYQPMSLYTRLTCVYYMQIHSTSDGEILALHDYRFLSRCAITRAHDSSYIPLQIQRPRKTHQFHILHSFIILLELLSCN